MSLIISRKGKNAKVIERSTIKNEDYLQEYIHENPDSIPIYEIKEGGKLLVIAREFETSSGPIDALAVDADGDIYIVETKLYRNTDKRKVVAQALDYGASLWRGAGDLDLFLERLDKEVEKKYHKGFEEKVSEFFNLDEESYSTLLDGVQQNLNTGTLRFVIMMDTMDERLKDLIVYVNQTSNFDIYGVELDFYEYEDKEIMIPRIFGVEMKKKLSAGTSGARRKWDRESFIAQTRERLFDRAEDVIGVLDWCYKNCDEISWGTGNQNGSYAPIVKALHPRISPFSLYTDGRIYLKLSWYPAYIDVDISRRLVDEFMGCLSEDGKRKYKRELVEKEPLWLDPTDLESGYDGIVEYLKWVMDTFN